MSGLHPWVQRCLPAGRLATKSWGTSKSLGFALLFLVTAAAVILGIALVWFLLHCTVALICMMMTGSDAENPTNQQ